MTRHSFLQYSVRTLALFSIAIALSACGGNNTVPTPSQTSASKALTHSTKATLASDYADVVQELYISYFGRPADPAGLVNFENALLAANAPTDVASLAAAYSTNPAIRSLIDSFGTSAESQNLYGSATGSTFVSIVFQNVLSRAPQAAGQAYWSNAINSGSLSRGDAALAIMAGALGNTTAQGQLDAQLINNRLTVAAYFTSRVLSQGAVGAYAGSSAAAAARNLLAGVTATTNTTVYQLTTIVFIEGLAGGTTGVGSPTVPSTPAGSAVGISFRPSAFSVVSNVASSAPIRFSIEATNATEFSGVSTLYAVLLDHADLFDPGVGVEKTASPNAYVANMGPSTKLAPGRYQGSFTLNLCADSQCQKPVPGSPWSFPYDFTITAAYYGAPRAVAIDGAGNIYITDSSSSVLSKVSANHVLSTISGTTLYDFRFQFGVAADASGNVFVSNDAAILRLSPAGNLDLLAGSYTGSADGVGAAANFYDPEGLAVDQGGNVYVADTYNHLIRKISSGGVVTTIAGQAGVSGLTDGTGSQARFNMPTAVAVDGEGNIYVADLGNSAIRKITSAGVVTTFAGGPSSPGSFTNLNGIAIDKVGNVFVADSTDNTIKKVTQQGVVTIFAGTPSSSLTGPNFGFGDGAGSEVRFYYPGGMAIDGLGNLYVADTINKVIRVITPAGEVSTLVASKP